MANSKGPSSFRNVTYSGKNSLLPPKSPFPSISPSYVDYLHSSAIGGKYIPKPREGNSHHQRTSSESILIEDQPSWLDELLDEPETPVRRAHRRSSSDSFAYMDAANPANMDYAAQDGSRSRNIASVPSWALQDITHHKDARHASFFSEANSMGICRNRAWESPLNSMAHPSGLLSAKDNFVPQDSIAPCTSHVSNDFPSTTTEQQNPVESGPHDRKASADNKDFSCVKASASETDTRRAKQQFAQRSRVRKLQYIAELERNVQALQAEGSEVTAELEFLNQQNLILSMENKALKQRQESLAQEQLIKYLEHEVLEREVGRLRGLYQQQQPQLPTSSHRRTNSRDLDSQFANLNLKHQEPSSGHDAVSGPVHI